MDVTRTTVPGTGLIHQFGTRAGQRFALLVDEAGRRHLLVYEAADPDAPAQTIVMERDEADQVAEVLHSRPIADRLARLERRFAEMTGEAP
ncbi:hypothetical protein [Spongiactinospora sp. 9N601]|uniref:hypothetical protein n=1 Tax=Spongiactinospora sp. 9N601 TaxID=3375149 RepID=UPI00378B94FB